MYTLLFFGFAVYTCSVATNDPCNNTEVTLSNLIRDTLEEQELPRDLLILTPNLTTSNPSLQLQNCSNILTLKHFLLNYSATASLDHLKKRYFSTLYAYAEFKHTILTDSKFVPKTHLDVLLLINSFSSTTIDPNLGRDLYSYFSHYGNWIETLISSKFPFDKYKSPRTLLLDMVCTLLKESVYSFYERGALGFLLVNNHTCPLARNSNKHDWPIEAEAKEDLLDDFFIQYLSGLALLRLKDGLSSNGTHYRLNLPVILGVENATIDLEALAKEYNSSQDVLANAPHLFSNITFTGTIEVRKYSNSTSNHTNQDRNSATISTYTVFPKANLSSTVRHKEESLGGEHLQHDVSLNVWDVVDMDGPCKEGRQHLVKLNVQSLLTAVDKNASKESLELFRKLLPTIREFPIQDYNARGELLRDLVPAVSKQQTNPLVKKKIEEILYYIILDGVGALPPKLKLECANMTESDMERIRRRTKRVFYSKRNYLVSWV